MNESAQVHIRPLDADHAATCRQILEALPDWFGDPQSVEDYSANTLTLHTIGAFSGQDCVGLLSLRNHFNCNVEIDVMAVLPGFHGRGVGRDLIGAALAHASSVGARFLTVKTVAETRDSEHYAMTRKFYRCTGFTDFEVLEDHWGEGLDALLLIQPVEERTTAAKDQPC